MAIYAIFDVDIHDAAAYEEYKKQVPALITKHGGEYLARGAGFEVLVGDWQPTRIVIFRWPSREAMEAFDGDPDYQELKALRLSASTTKNFLLVEGN